LAIDWFLDRCRTTVNVWGDSVGAAVVDRLEVQRRASRDEVEEY
ncbi:MAG: cation:dicarboxylase symporter family transporter, partial [Candidatus Coatesbacteria bacterium]